MYWGDTRTLEYCGYKSLGYLYGSLAGKSGSDFSLEDNDAYACFVQFANNFNYNVIDMSKLGKVKVIGKKNKKNNVTIKLL